MKISNVIKSLSASNAAIKNTASLEPKDGWYPTYSASGQDVWLPNYRFEQKGIVVSAVGARCGKAFKADGKWNVCANTHPLSVDETIADRDYCWYMLNNENWWIKGGTAQPFIKVKDSLNREHDFPSIDVQKEIVAELNKISSIITLRKAEFQKLDELIKARFVELFGDPKYNKNNLVKIEEIGTLTSGGTPSRSRQEYFEGCIRWYSAGELNTLYLPDSIEHISEKALCQSSAKLFNKGTLMIGMYDTAAFKMGILTENSSSNQACANLNPNGAYNVVWLYYLFDMMKPVFLKERQGVRQKNLSLSKIKGFEIPNAPLEGQNQFSEFVEQVDKSKFAVQKSLDEAQLLFDSLMQQYFG